MVHPDGKPWGRTFIFRREQAQIDDVWQVMGLRGTGSDNYTVKGLFVDDAHSLTREYEPERRQHGALYSFQAMQL
jgi:indole-3-acetate monooxygenase